MCAPLEIAIDTLTLRCFHLSRNKVCLSQANTRAYAVPDEEPKIGISTIDTYILGQRYFFATWVAGKLYSDALLIVFA